MSATININGKLMDFSIPKVMGILNVTPDSFYQESRVMDEKAIISRSRQIVDEGGDIIDVGACSTRPDSLPVDEKEELHRLQYALNIIRKYLPDFPVSVDTFRPNIARQCIEEYNVGIVNFCKGDNECLLDVDAPVILTSEKNNIHDMLLDFAFRTQTLRAKGQKDIIVDPGFGFGKTLEENFSILKNLDQLQCLNLPILVGVSRKSMIWKTLELSADNCLNGTTVLNTIALSKGTNILRVHDVKEAIETIKLTRYVF